MSSSRAARRWRTAANAVSAGRAALGVAVFAWAAVAPVGDVSAAEGVVLAALLVISIGLDGVDGWVARRRGSDSATGSYVDVLCDRVTEDAGWIFLAAQSQVWGVAILVLMLRNCAVDAIKAGSSYAGHELEIGVQVTGWRLAIVKSRASRVGHNLLKTLALATGLLVTLFDWEQRWVVTALLLAFLVLSLARGAASIAELPLTLRRGRVGPPARLAAGFLIQACLAALTLAAVAFLTFR
ncbi:MAG: CDP-alcohol phosphatidyltransferase family protein [Solirubrobacterales bacterium]